MGKANTSAVKESHASQSAKTTEFLKRKSKPCHKRQKKSKKSFQFLYKFGATVSGEGGEDRNKREGS